MKKFFVLLLTASLSGCQTISEEAQKRGINISSQDVCTGFGAIGGAVLGNIAGRQLGNSNLAKIAGTVGGAAAGGWISRSLCALNEEDREEAVSTVQTAAVTGKDGSWHSETTGASGSARVVETTTETQPVAIPVLKDRVEQVPPLDLIGEPYRATASVNVRGGPGTDYRTVGTLGADETVMVAGQVQGQDWYMISQDGAASGFVSTSLLRPAPPETTVAASSEPLGEVETVSLETERTCRTINQSITLGDGTTSDEKVTACQGPNGWEVI